MTDNAAKMTHLTSLEISMLMNVTRAAFATAAFCTAMLSGPSFALTDAEQTLVVRDQAADLQLTNTYRLKDELLKARKAAAKNEQETTAFDNFLRSGAPADRTQDDHDQCVARCTESCNTNTGGEACWTACTNEGYSSSTCASRCGTSTSGGSQACWSRCTTEGYTSSTCASRCGTSTSGGSEGCWNSCSREGYTSSTCSSRCGVTTGGGSRACWDRCSTEGYTSSTCASRCGISTPEGSGACWNRCTTEGYTSSTCASRCGVN